MKHTKRDRLAAAGWHVGDAADFLELNAAEAAYVEFRVAVANVLRDLRARHGISQTQLAARMGSSQSRVAFAEQAGPGVSLDLSLRALCALGLAPGEIADAILRQTRRLKRSDRPATGRASSRRRVRKPPERTQPLRSRRTGSAARKPRP